MTNFVQLIIDGFVTFSFLVLPVFFYILPLDNLSSSTQTIFGTYFTYLVPIIIFVMIGLLVTPYSNQRNFFRVYEVLCILLLPHLIWLFLVYFGIGSQSLVNALVEPPLIGLLVGITILCMFIFFRLIQTKRPRLLLTLILCLLPIIIRLVSPFLLEVSSLR